MSTGVLFLLYRGKGDYFRLGHGSDNHVRKPQIVEGLKDKKVIHVAVGALHCLAVTDQGQVYAWGDNDHGQQVRDTHKKEAYILVKQCSCKLVRPICLG